MKISQREMMLGVVTLTCVLFGGTWYAADGKMEKWKSMKGEITSLRQQISVNQTAIKKQNEWLGQLNELEKELRIFDLKQRSVTSDLQKTIAGIANKYGLNITRNQPHDEKPTGNLYEVAINCTWEGSLESIIDFLSELQQQGIRYDVRTLNITPFGKNTDKLKGNMVVNCAYTRRNMTEQPE